MRRILIIALLLSACMYGRGQTMSLKDCIRLGIENNLTVANARIGVSKGHAGVSQNRARLLPSITGVLQFTDYLKRPVNVTSGTVLGNDFPDGPTWQTIRSMQYNVSTGIQLNVPLYNQSIYAAIDVARTVEQLSHLSYDMAAEELTVQIGKVYYMAQASLEQASLAGENIARMQELHAITKAMFEQGIVLEVDLNRININLRNLETRRDLLDMMYARQINMLRFLMDLPPETLLDVERMPAAVESSPAPGISSGLPELQAARLQKKLIEDRIRAVRAGYIPSVSFTGYAGALGYQEKFSHFFHTRDSSRNWFGNCFVGLTVTVPIFDASSKKLQMRQLGYDLEQAVNRENQLMENIAREYSDAMLQASHNIEVYDTQVQSYRQAMDVYKVTEEQYREGVASMTAILQDEMQLRTAQAACVQAHCEFNLARLDLLRLSGSLSLLTE